MNNFTKEELENIYDGLELWNSQHFCSGMKNIHLKIQSMIENYCEHEYLTFLAEQNNEPFVVKCIKCHKLDFFEKL